jgi:FMN-dependent NADH-azoreductase
MEVEVTDILLVTSGPRVEPSTSRRIAMALVESLLRERPDLKMTERFAGLLPHAGNDLVAAHGAPEDRRDAHQAELVALNDAVVTEVEQARLIVVAAPMYSYTVPSSIKSWIDHLNWRGRTYLPTPDGREGMLKGRRTYVIATRGVSLPEDHPHNFHETYLRVALGYYGLKDLEVIAAENTARPTGAEEVARAIAAAEAAGRDVAAWWG